MKLALAAALIGSLAPAFAEPPAKHPGAEEALSKIVLEKDYGDLKFHSREVVTIADNDRVPGLNGLMFVRWKGEKPGEEIMASVQWFEEKADLMKFYAGSIKRQPMELEEIGDTKVWKMDAPGGAGYAWTDGEHFLVSLGGAPAPPPELVKAWLAKIGSRVADIEEASE